LLHQGGTKATHVGTILVRDYFFSTRTSPDATSLVQLPWFSRTTYSGPVFKADMINKKPPDWFKQAINTPYSDRWIDVDNCAIHYQIWSEDKKDLPGLLLVHGHGANAHWWDFIAPGLMQEYRVAALDISGAGDSGHRTAYSTEQFVAEIMSVMEDAGFKDKCILVGHSFGGRMARFAGHLYPDSFSGVLLVDSAISLPGRRTIFRIPEQAKRPTRLYPSRKEAARRFRLRPPQPCANGFIVDYIAEHSVKEVAGGWCWKLDQRVFSKMADLASADTDPGEMLRNMQCPVAIIYGDQSRFFDAQVKSYVCTLVDKDNVISIEDAHHHLFLDQPLLFISVLRGLLTSWPDR
jgi:pimeloyl-ACP methyl ester carboxylesterase